MTAGNATHPTGPAPLPTVARLAAQMQDMPGALLPLLHAIQDTLGYIPPESLGTIAAALKLSRAEVHGVVSFYHHFKTVPGGRTVVQLCRAEACKSMGADALWRHACSQLQLDEHQAAHGATTADQSVTLEPVYCLGLCSTSPAIAVNSRPYARVQMADLDRLIQAAGSVA